MKFTIDADWLIERSNEENEKIKSVGMIAKVRTFFNEKDATRRLEEIQRSMGRMEMINEIFMKYNKYNQ